jgi:archaeal flagellar protein FlaI
MKKAKKKRKSAKLSENIKPKEENSKAETNFEKSTDYLKNLYILHEKKKNILNQHLVYNFDQEGIDEFLNFSNEQKNILEKDFDLLKIDWDKLVYTQEDDSSFKQIVFKKLLGTPENTKKFTPEEEKLIEDLLIFIKMYYFLIKEEKNFLEEKDITKLKKNIFEQANNLLKIFSTLNSDFKKNKENEIDRYDFHAKNIPITVKILKKSNEFVPIYVLIISKISRYTEYFLEKIRKELVHNVNLGIIDITDVKRKDLVEERFSATIVNLINKYFPDIDTETSGFLTTYLIHKALGLGKVDLIMNDPFIEEIAINSSEEPIWVYHKKHAWVKTNIQLDSEEQIKRYATMIGRKVGRQISVLEPLLDASLNTGDRVNATLMPISNHGNTITLRKFAAKPWTITDLIKAKTLSATTAAMIWLGMQYELSALVIGGTASGKTSMLNALANLFPPNQRILTIEDTREIQLPKFLHWVPMTTRLPNAEGKGGISMLDLMINSLRQRPDRILVGEIRQKKEAEVAFEAIHTGHSVYGTFHANTADDAVTRLTSPPISIPPTTLPGIAMMIVQYRNRRTGQRRTFQFSEITDKGKANVLLQYDANKDVQVEVNKSNTMLKTIQTFTGMSDKQINDDIKEKIEILNWLVENDINDVDKVGRIMAKYYIDKENLMKTIIKKKKVDKKNGRK